MKRALIITQTILFYTTSLFADFREPRGRYYPEDENIGLPDLGFTGKALIVGAVLFALGWIISKANQKPNGEGGSSLGGCLIMLGIICAIPCLFWIQTIVASLWVLGVGLVIILTILYFIWHSIKGK